MSTVQSNIDAKIWIHENFHGITESNKSILGKRSRNSTVNESFSECEPPLKKQKVSHGHQLIQILDNDFHSKFLKVIELLTNYPLIIEDGYILSQLKEIKARVSQKIDTDEALLFSKLIDRPFSHVLLKNRYSSESNSQPIEFKLNSALYVKYSDFFRGWFLSNTTQKELTSEYEYPIWACVNEFLQKGDQELIPKELVLKVFELADFLGIQELVYECVELLIDWSKKISFTDLKSVYQLIDWINHADKFPQYPKLQEHLFMKISEFIQRSFNGAETIVNFLEIKQLLLQNLNSSIRLEMNQCFLKDLDLIHLVDLSIHELSFIECESLTKNCLIYLKNFKSLRKLVLIKNNWLSRKSISGLRNFNQLKELYIEEEGYSNHRIDDTSLSDLPKSLEKLGLFNCDLITDDFVRSIALLESLSDLELDSCRNLSDEGIMFLPDQLVMLTLMNCPNVTDRALIKIGKMKKLRKLFIKDCRQVTQPGIDRLKATCPNLQVLQ